MRERIYCDVKSHWNPERYSSLSAAFISFSDTHFHFYSYFSLLFSFFYSFPLSRLLFHFICFLFCAYLLRYLKADLFLIFLWVFFLFDKDHSFWFLRLRRGPFSAVHYRRNSATRLWKSSIDEGMLDVSHILNLPPSPYQKKNSIANAATIDVSREKGSDDLRAAK